MKESSYDSIKANAGQTGDIAARTTASKGFSVMVIEKKNEIGQPVHCGEGISNNAPRLNQTELFLLPDYI